MKITKSIIYLISLIISDNLCAQTPEVRSIDSLMKLYEANNCFNGELLVVDKLKPIYSRTIGYRNNDTKEVLKSGSLFNIGSVSKPFTAVAILQLQEKGLLKIDDPVKKYIPLFPYENICIKHLLSHTSGIIANLNLEYEPGRTSVLTNDSIIELLLKDKPALESEPGEKWSYSNLGYEILSLVVEQVSKMSFNDFLQKNIFEPAKMHRTFVAQTNDIVRWLPKGLSETDIALPHNFESFAECNVKNIFPGIIQSKAYFFGSTNVYTTTQDLARFDEALSDNIILTQASQRLAFTPYKLNDGTFATDSLAPMISYYGLGWEISADTSGGKIVWHKGRSGGTRAVFLRNTSRNQRVALLDNYDDWSCDLKAIACLNIINHQPYKNPIYQSLVQKFGCDIVSIGYDKAYQKFLDLRKTQGQNYFVSKDEMNELAIDLDSQNDLKSALSVSKLCNELYPDFLDGLLTYGDLYLKNKEVEKGIDCYRKAVPLYGESESERIELLGIIGAQLIEKERLSDAEIVLKLNTEIFPEDCNSFDNYAFILDKNNKLDQAISVQEHAVALAMKHNDKLLDTLKENLKNLRAKK